MGLEVLTTCLFPRNSVRVCLSITGCPHIVDNAWLNTRNCSCGKNKLIWKLPHVIVSFFLKWWDFELMPQKWHELLGSPPPPSCMDWFLWLDLQPGKSVESSDNLWKTAGDCQSSHSLISPASVFTCKDYHTNIPCFFLLLQSQKG